MFEENSNSFDTIVVGNLVILRSWVENDRNYYKRWLVQGEWLQYDAPWAQGTSEGESDQDKKTNRKKVENDVGVKKLAIITTLDQIPLGWVNRYGDPSNPYIWFVGIDICEDNYLNKGYGTEALRAWVDYLFSDSEIHKICLDAWSFNPRMIRVAEKVGFKYEGSQREMRYWEDEWLDLMHFGILREEWERNH